MKYTASKQNYNNMIALMHIFIIFEAIQNRYVLWKQLYINKQNK